MHVLLEIRECSVTARANTIANTILYPCDDSACCLQPSLRPIRKFTILDRPLPVVVLGLLQSIHFLFPLRLPETELASLRAIQSLSPRSHVLFQCRRHRECASTHPAIYYFQIQLNYCHKSPHNFTKLDSILDVLARLSRDHCGNLSDVRVSLHELIRETECEIVKLRFRSELGEQA